MRHWYRKEKISSEIRLLVEKKMMKVSTRLKYEVNNEPMRQDKDEQLGLRRMDKSGVKRSWQKI